MHDCGMRLYGLGLRTLSIMCQISGLNLVSVLGLAATSGLANRLLKVFVPSDRSDFHNECVHQSVNGSMRSSASSSYKAKNRK